MSLTCGLVSRCPPKNAIAMGWYDINDLATQTTPLSILADTDTYLTNDGIGEFTRSDFGLSGTIEVYDDATQSFDFSGLKIGDTVGIRLDLRYETSSPNQSVAVKLNLGIGQAGEYFIKWGSELVYKTADIHPFSVYNKIYIGNDLTKNNPAKFSVLSDDGLDVVVNGFFVEVMQRW